MKKITYISGIVCIILILVGSLFKIQHWPGAGLALILGLGSFCFWFLPAALINNYRNAGMKHWKWVYIATFITFFIDTLGALFKIMHWPGAGWFLILGIPLPFILFLPVFIYWTSREKNFPMINYMGIMFGLTFLGVFTALLALNVSKNVISFGLIMTQNNVNAYHYYPVSESETSEISNQVDEICIFIDDLTARILVTKENQEKFKRNEESDILNIDMMNSQEETRKILYGSEEEVGDILKLKNMLTELRETCTDLPLEDEALKNMIVGLLDTETSIMGNRTVVWEDKEEFWVSYMQLTLATLTRIQENVKFLEHEVDAELNLKKIALN